jgi:hypothetical protein
MNAVVGSQLLSQSDKPASAPIARPLAIVSSISPLQNQLLAALSAEVQQRLFPELELCQLSQGTILDEPGVPTEYFHFPIDCLISRQCMMEDGACTEVSMVGNDGLVGMDLFMGQGTAPTRSVVQIAGSAFRLESRWIKEELNRASDLLQLLFRYAHSLIFQTAQTAVCNRHHNVEQQLCRWLLLSLDRIPDKGLKMTQEQIANALGVRRQSVTEAASKLQKQGLVKYARGNISVLNRPALEKLSCECYQVVKRETDRMLASAASNNASQWNNRSTPHHH